LNRTFDFASPLELSGRDDLDFDFEPFSMTELEARSVLQQYNEFVPESCGRGFLCGDELMQYGYLGVNPCYFYAYERTRPKAVAGLLVYNYEAKMRWVNVIHVSCIAMEAYPVLIRAM
jgi:hypothetical protein